jgi:hypothetical protein
MNTIAVASRNKQSYGFHVESLTDLDENVNVGDEVRLNLPEINHLVRGSVVRIEPDENRCIIQILGMYNF